jgi:hypothetical protein
MAIFRGETGVISFHFTIMSEGLPIGHKKFAQKVDSEIKRRYILKTYRTFGFDYNGHC